VTTAPTTNSRTQGIIELVHDNAIVLHVPHTDYHLRLQLPEAS